MMTHIKATRVGRYTTLIAIVTNELGAYGMPVKNTMFYARNKMFKEHTTFIQEYGEYEGKPYIGMMDEVINKISERYSKLI